MTILDQASETDTTEVLVGTAAPADTPVAPNKASTKSQGVQPGYQIKLCDFDFRESKKGPAAPEEVRRKKPPGTHSNYVRFTLEWSVKLANGHFHSWRCRGCIFTRTRRGDLGWHPPMTKHSSLGTAYQPHELSKDLYADVLDYITANKRDWVDWVSTTPDPGDNPAENVMVVGVAA